MRASTDWLQEYERPLGRSTNGGTKVQASGSRERRGESHEVVSLLGLLLLLCRAWPFNGPRFHQPGLERFSAERHLNPFTCARPSLASLLHFSFSSKALGLASFTFFHTCQLAVLHLATRPPLIRLNHHHPTSDSPSRIVHT